jgi:signal transduction histidine kinase
VSQPPSKIIGFRPRARIIRTIGDQLISGPEAAVIELVKNAYDADANQVSIKFVPPLLAGFGEIVIADDGHGMSVTDLVEKWMEPATSSKVTNRVTARGRRMLGSKGIGRFAAAKLGKTMSLRSVSGRAGSRTEATIPSLDWTMFEEDRYLSDIEIPFSDRATDDPTGTTIVITTLREAWSRERMSALISELRRLVSPLYQQSDTPQFRIFLDLSECTDRTCGFDGPSLIGASPPDPDEPTGIATANGVELQPFPLIATSDYLVEGYFDDDGKFHGTMEIRRGGQAATPIELEVPLREGEESCGRVEVHLSIFDREADVVRDTMRRAGLGELTAAKARQILDETAGVAIYRDGFRVRPYGNLAHDWLALDSRRVQDPSLRIGQNQVAGFLTVEGQSDSNLVERSSREGFEENAAFRRLRELIIELFAKAVEPRRLNFRTGAQLSRGRKSSFEGIEQLSQLRPVRQAIADLPEPKRKIAEEAIDREAARLQSEIDELKDRQRVLEAKSSLGLIIGELIHEGAPEANFLAVSSSRLKTNWPLVFTQGPKSQEAREDFPKRLNLMSLSGDRLRTLFVNLRPLAGGRRMPPGSFNIMNVIHETVALFETHNVVVEVQKPEEVTECFGHREDLATAIINLVSNATYWLEQSGTEDPRITISSHWVENDVAICIEDNGPGVPDEFAERIFDIRFTLKEGGTGLGLNIAQEALARSNARLFFHPEHPSGAKFEIRFPRYRGADV